jgi:cytochrome c-type biogenesis protein CcmH
MMELFYALAGLFVFAIVSVVVWPLLRLRQPKAERPSSNYSLAQIDALRTTSAQIAADETAGAITPVEASARRKELLLQARAETPQAPFIDIVTSAPTDRVENPKYGLACLALVAVGTCGALLYKKLGRPDGIALTAISALKPDVDREQMVTMVRMLDTRLTGAPLEASDVKAWKMLARSHFTLGNFEKSIAAHRAVLKLESVSVETETGLIEALLAQNRGKPNAETDALLASAYKRSPQDAKVIWLNATAAQERGDPNQAVVYLKALLATLPPGREDAKQIENYIRALSK